MTTSLDTQVPDPAAIEATEQPRMIRILDDADLDAVNGGSDNVHDAAVRAALGVLYNNTLHTYETNEMIRNNPCGFYF